MVETVTHGRQFAEDAEQVAFGRVDRSLDDFAFAGFDHGAHGRSKVARGLACEDLEERVAAFALADFDELAAFNGRCGEHADTDEFGFSVRAFRANAVHGGREGLDFGLRDHFLKHGFRETLELGAGGQNAGFCDLCDAGNAVFIVEVGNRVCDFRHRRAGCRTELPKHFLEVAGEGRNLTFEGAQLGFVGIELSAEGAGLAFCCVEDAAGRFHAGGLAGAVGLELFQAGLILGRHLVGVLFDFRQDVAEGLGRSRRSSNQGNRSEKNRSAQCLE